jgi:hypothetical protein
MTNLDLLRFMRFLHILFSFTLFLGLGTMMMNTLQSRRVRSPAVNYCLFGNRVLVLVRGSPRHRGFFCLSLAIWRQNGVDMIYLQLAGY